MLESDRNGGTTSGRRLSYKYQRLRERLREAISTGELSGRLPGERELARRYGANAKTLNKALNDLAIEGLLIRHVGRGTCVAKDVAADPILGRTRRFRWLVGAADNHAFRQEAFDRAAAITRDSGHEIERLEIKLDAAGALPNGALSPGQLREVDGIVVYATQVSKPFVADLIRRHIPFVLANTLSNEATTNTVNPDYARGAFELAEHLIGLGYRDIRLVIRPDESPALMLAKLGYATAMQRYTLAPRPVVLLGEETDTSNRTRLAELLDGEYGATAAICAGTDAIEAVSREIGAGLPADLPLVGLVEPGQPVDEGRRLTTYEVDVDRIVDWTMRMLIEAAPAQRPQQVIVPGAVVHRGLTTVPQPQSSASLSPTDAVI